MNPTLMAAIMVCGPPQNLFSSHTALPLGWRSIWRHPAVNENLTQGEQLPACRVCNSRRLITCPVTGQTLNTYEPLYAVI